MDVNGNLLEYRHVMKREEYRDIWGKSYGNELGRLAQGIGDNIQGTDTIFFLKKQTYLSKDKEKSLTAKQCAIIEKERKIQIEKDWLWVATRLKFQ